MERGRDKEREEKREREKEGRDKVGEMVRARRKGMKKEEEK